MRFYLGLGRMTLLILSIEIIIIKLVTKFERWRGTKAGFMTKGLTRVCVCVSTYKGYPKSQKAVHSKSTPSIVYDKFDIQ